MNSGGPNLLDKNDFLGLYSYALLSGFTSYRILDFFSVAHYGTMHESVQKALTAVEFLSIE